MVANEPNRYAQQFISTHLLHRRSLMRKCKDTNANEIENFFGIIIIMGIVQLPQLRLCWSKDPMFRNELIKRWMTRNMFDLACYRKAQENEGAENARKKAKRLMTYCKNCEGMPIMCLECFNEKHS